MKSTANVSGLPVDIFCNASCRATVEFLCKSFLLWNEPAEHTLVIRSVNGALSSNGLNIRLIQRTIRHIVVELPEADVTLVSAAIGLSIADALSSRDGFLLHAAGLIRKDRAFLFVGPSGSGKSTVVSNATGVKYINDDIMAVRKVNGIWHAYGVPMRDNNGNPSTNLSAPIGGVFLIERGKSLKVSPLRAKRDIARLLEQFIQPFTDSKSMLMISSSALAMLSEVPLSILRFARDSDVSDVLE